MNVPMLLSYGLEGPVGIAAGDRIRWRSSNGEDNSYMLYMGTARSMLTKFPGFIFSGLNTVALFSSIIISENDYKTYMQDAYNIEPKREEKL